MESKTKWRDRIYGAWQVLTGKAYAAYYIQGLDYSFWNGRTSEQFNMSQVNDPTTWDTK